MHPAEGGPRVRRRSRRRLGRSWLRRGPAAHSSLSPPVTASMADLGAGPTASTVRLPGATCVRPASCTTNVGRPLPAAAAASARSSWVDPACRQICAHALVGGRASAGVGGKRGGAEWRRSAAPTPTGGGDTGTGASRQRGSAAGSGARLGLAAALPVTQRRGLAQLVQALHCADRRVRALRACGGAGMGELVGAWQTWDAMQQQVLGPGRALREAAPAAAHQSCPCPSSALEVGEGVGMRGRQHPCRQRKGSDSRQARNAPACTPTQRTRVHNQHHL